MLQPSIESEFGTPDYKTPLLGKGAYGMVRKHHSVKRGSVAVKTMIWDEPELSGDVVREISCLTSLAGHPDIIELLGWQLPDVVAGDTEVKLALEYGEHGSLSSVLKRQRLSDVQIKSALYQLMRGTAFMHARDIWHRDIKPGNVIVTQLDGRGASINVKLADFGLARSGPFCDVTQTEVMYTLWYRPPEILVHQFLGQRTVDFRNYNEKADLWALGVVFWDMLAASRGRTGASVDYMRGMSVKEQLRSVMRAIGWPTQPHDTPYGWSPREFRRLMENKDYTFSAKLIPNVAREKWHPIEKLLEMNTDERGMLMGLLRLNDTARLSSFDALRHPYFDGVRNEAELAETFAVAQLCFADLRIRELSELTARGGVGVGAAIVDRVSTSEYLPGASEGDKFLNYTSTAALMLDFVTQTRMDMAVFGLAVDLLHTVLLRPDRVQSPRTRYMLATLGISCTTLAAKYFQHKAPSVMDSLKIIGATCTPQEMADFESRVFIAVGGDLNLPTAHRMLLDLTGCQSELYAWSVALLFLILTTRASFNGKRSEQAALAAMIASHYTRTELKTTTRCDAVTYPLNMAVLNAGVRVVLEDLSRVVGGSATHTFLLDGTMAVLRALLPVERHSSIPSTLEEFMTILSGRRQMTLPVLPPVFGGVESDDDDETFDSADFDVDFDIDKLVLPKNQRRKLDTASGEEDSITSYFSNRRQSAPPPLLLSPEQSSFDGLHY